MKLISNVTCVSDYSSSSIDCKVICMHDDYGIPQLPMKYHLFCRLYDEPVEFITDKTISI